MIETTVREAVDADRVAVDALLTRAWTRPYVVIGGVGHDLTALPTLVAEREGELAGALTYRTDDRGVEIMSVNGEGGGAGTALIRAVIERALSVGAPRVTVATSNDNTVAQRFYQKNGFRYAGVRRDAIAFSRRQKPAIPLENADGLPLADEIVLELRLDGVDGGPVEAGRVAVSRALTWRGGETDLWPLLADPYAVTDVVRGLAYEFLGRVDVVAGPDPGGLLFGPRVAAELGVPFAPVCRDRRFFFQGGHETVSAGELLAHRAAFGEGARVLLVDDWSESGMTVKAVTGMLEGTGASLVGVSFLIGNLSAEARDALSGVEIRALAEAGELEA